MLAHFTRLLPIATFTATLLVAGLTPAHAQSLDQNQGPIEVEDTAPIEPAPARASGRTGSQKNKSAVGRSAAQKYMGAQNKKTETVESTPDFSVRSTPDSHYLAVHVGGFVSDNAYKWGTIDNQKNVGKWNIGVTYRVGEWVNSMDLGVRLDLASYKLAEGRSNKLSFIPVITFPDAGSKFPLYFGAGAGLGIFLNQFGSESSLALDYQIFGGVRFFDVIGNAGFFLEGGLKNSLFLLSDGQYNGVFVTVGTNFTF